MKIICIGNLMLFCGKSNLCIKDEPAGTGVGFAILRAQGSQAKHRILTALIEKESLAKGAPDAE